MIRPGINSTLLLASWMLLDVGTSSLCAESPRSHAQRAGQIMDATGIRGGLVVHLGCGDGQLVAEFGEQGFLAMGLDDSAERVTAARRLVRELGLYGEVSIAHWRGDRLPFIDNLVNLVVVEQNAGAANAEILRILAPHGVAYIRKGDQWEKLVKPRPDEMDDWTHFMYDATGNAVSRDGLVAPPEHQQWVGGPPWGRHHDHMASMTSMVSAGDRVFYIFDEGSTASIMLPSKWHLIARDAFNGVVLWKKPLPRWWTRFHPLKSGPAELSRLLVASSQHVYAPLGLREPISQLDGATGETLQTYRGTENTWEMILAEPLLLAVTGSSREQEEGEAKLLFANERRAPGNPFSDGWTNWNRKLVVVDTTTGNTQWERRSIILPGTLAADAATIYYHDSNSIVALDKRTGEQRWVSEPVAAIDIARGIPTGFMPSLVVVDGIVVFAGGRDYAQHMRGKTDQMVALGAEDGSVLWTAPHYTSGYQSPMDLLVVNRRVLSPFSTWLKPQDSKNNIVAATDLMTGEDIREYKEDVTDPVWFIHHRCYPSKATENYLLLSKEGVEFIDLETNRWKINHWVRGECLYGIMPANGLLYAPMHDCACSADMKLNGLNALAAPKLRSSAVDVGKHQLTRGPAFGKVSESGPAGPADWPTFRHDAARSGVASGPCPGTLEKGWTAEIGGRLSAPVVANGRVYIASVHDHSLHVLDEQSGESLWTFSAEGRIDSPPTVHRGMVLLGSRDGCVYCLRATDGALIWRFRAVATDQRLMAWEQVESVWPVHGSILIHNEAAWFVAGRSSFLDGGLQMFRLDPETGQVLSHATFRGVADDGRILTGAEEKRLVGRPDILSADEDCVFMRAGVFKLEGNTIQRYMLPPSKVIRYAGQSQAPPSDMPTDARVHLFSSYGFLDDSWFHRSYWVYGELCSHRHNYSQTGAKRPAGRLLVVDDQNVYGFGRQKQYFSWTTPMEYRLFADPKKATRTGNSKGGGRNAGNSSLWESNVPLLATGLVLADDTLFAAGAPDVLDETQPGIRREPPAVLQAIKEQEEALAGKRGGVLVAVSRDAGDVRHRYDLDAPPVFDGLIAANGRLYLALKDGTIQCWRQ